MVNVNIFSSPDDDINEYDDDDDNDEDNEFPTSTGITNIMDEVKKAVMDGISPLYKKLPQYFLVV